MAQVRIHKVGAKTALWYAATGRPINGLRKTNARFFVRGTRILDGLEVPPRSGWCEPTRYGHALAYRLEELFPQRGSERGHGYVTGAAYRSWLEMMVLRWSLLAGTTVVPVAYAVNPDVTAPWLVMTGVGTVGAVATRQVQIVTAGLKRQTRHAVVSQLHDAFGSRQPRVRLEYDGRRLVELAVGIPSGVVLTDVTQKSIKAVISKVAPTLTEADWPNMVNDRTVVLTAPQEAPTLVKYAQVRQAMLDAPSGTLVLGVDASDHVVTHSLDNDAPHVLVTMESGGGKSVKYRSLISQLVEQGAKVDILDVKQISLHEFADSPGIDIYTDVAAIWDLVSTFKTEMMERYEELKAVSYKEHPRLLAGYQRKVLFFEEMNGFQLASQVYWDSIRGQGERAAIPALQDLAEILAMARQVKMNVFVAGQRIDRKTLGGSSAFENFGLRLLSNPSTATWRMHGDGKKPAGSKIKGRHVALIGGTTVIHQGIYTTQDEAVQHCATQREQWPVVVRQSQVKPQDGAYVRRATERAGITLREIADRSGKTLAAVRKQRERETWPVVGTDGKSDLFDMAMLARVGTPSFDPNEVVTDTDE